MSNLSDVREQNITVMLSGKEYVLKFDLNAFADLEEEYGTIDEALMKMQTGSVKAIRAVLWAGLRVNDESMTQKEVGALVNGFADITLIAEKLNEAITVAMPTEKNE